jgi:signal transduction histidine kinase
VGNAAPVAPPAILDGFYRDIVESIGTGVVAIDRHGRIAVMNRPAHRMLSLPEDPPVIGRSYHDVLDAHRDLARVLGSAFEIEHLPNRAELRLKTSGKVIGYTLALVRDRDDRPSGAALLFKDLTRVEQIEERERLRDRLAALGEMAAAIAHEVKNPLAGIEVTAGVLKRHLRALPDARGALDDIINEAKMANAIVQEVLEFVRPLRLQVEPVALDPIVRDAVAMARRKAEGRAAAVELRLPADLPPIQADPHQLRQLFVNLLANAFEAFRGSGLVDISGFHYVVEDEPGCAGLADRTMFITVEVADDGPGIPPELRDRIFNPFFTTKPRGSGLGLAIVRKIVDAHDGRIDVSARPEGGTRFRVTLPAAGPYAGGDRATA